VADETNVKINFIGDESSYVKMLKNVSAKTKKFIDSVIGVSESAKNQLNLNSLAQQNKALSDSIIAATSAPARSMLKLNEIKKKSLEKTEAINKKMADSNSKSVLENIELSDKLSGARANEAKDLDYISDSIKDHEATVKKDLNTLKAYKDILTGSRELPGHEGDRQSLIEAEKEYSDRLSESSNKIDLIHSRLDELSKARDIDIAKAKAENKEVGPVLQKYAPEHVALAKKLGPEETKREKYKERLKYLKDAMVLSKLDIKTQIEKIAKENNSWSVEKQSHKDMIKFNAENVKSIENEIKLTNKKQMAEKKAIENELKLSTSADKKEISMMEKQVKYETRGSDITGRTNKRVIEANRKVEDMLETRKSGALDVIGMDREKWSRHIKDIDAFNVKLEKGKEKIKPFNSGLANMASAFRKAVHGTKGFRMEMLAVMFFGKTLQDTLGQYTSHVMDMTGISSYFGTTMNMIVYDAMEPMVDSTFDVIDGLNDLDPAFKQAIGWASIIGEVFGNVLFVFGSLVLGLGGLVQAFGGAAGFLGSVLGKGMGKLFGPMFKAMGMGETGFADFVGAMDVSKIAGGAIGGLKVGVEWIQGVWEELGKKTFTLFGNEYKVTDTLKNIATGIVTIKMIFDLKDLAEQGVEKFRWENMWPLLFDVGILAGLNRNLAKLSIGMIASIQLGIELAGAVDKLLKGERLTWDDVWRLILDASIINLVMGGKNRLSQAAIIIGVGIAFKLTTDLVKDVQEGNLTGAATNAGALIGDAVLLGIGLKLASGLSKISLSGLLAGGLGGLFGGRGAQTIINSRLAAGAAGASAGGGVEYIAAGGAGGGIMAMLSGLVLPLTAIVAGVASLEFLSKPWRDRATESILENKKYKKEFMESSRSPANIMTAEMQKGIYHEVSAGDFIKQVESEYIKFEQDYERQLVNSGIPAAYKANVTDKIESEQASSYNDIDKLNKAASDELIRRNKEAYPDVKDSITTGTLTPTKEVLTETANSFPQYIGNGLQYMYSTLEDSAAGTSIAFQNGISYPMESAADENKIIMVNLSETTTKEMADAIINNKPFLESALLTGLVTPYMSAINQILIALGNLQSASKFVITKAQTASKNSASSFWSSSNNQLSSIMKIFFGNALPFASGGIVTRPTFAMIGEHGPEAVIPLSETGSMGSFNAVINVNVDHVNSDIDMNELAEKVSSELQWNYRRMTLR
jgi:hypothetical protein